MEIYVFSFAFFWCKVNCVIPNVIYNPKDIGMRKRDGWNPYEKHIKISLNFRKKNIILRACCNVPDLQHSIN